MARSISLTNGDYASPAGQQLWPYRVGSRQVRSVLRPPCQIRVLLHIFEFYYFKYAVLEKLKSEVFNVMFWLFCHLQSVILSCLECPAR